ncbi:MAG: hypothetical protein K2Y22_04225 [Candidatus Obscuribacterales bacterium]|nr:hypothetical protein [Candidatus Obscuribacterales bacterium]
MADRAVKDYVLKEREVFEGAFLYLQSDGTPVDMTGWTAKLQIRKSPGSATLYETLTEVAGITIDTVTGRVSWIIHTEDTAVWTFSKAVWDLKLIDASDDERVIIEGAIRREKAVTQ